MPVFKPLRVIGLVLLLAALGVLFGQQMRASAQTPDPGQVELGAQLYAENCAVCHGPNGEGRVGATLAQDWPSIRPDLTVRDTIAQGIPGSVMPAWSQAHGGPLSEAEIDALTAFILTWQTGSPSNLPTGPTATAHPPLTPAPDVEGDPNHGAVLFGENCVVCHGPDGEGRIGATLPTNWPSIRPDLNIKSIVSTGIPGSLMPAWSQQHGGPLAEQEINDIVSFLLSRPQSPVVQVSPQAPPVSPVSVPWLSGWGGVLIFFILFVTILAGALIFQRRV